MGEQLRKLNCMNYCVANYEGHYFLQCGLRSLYNFSKQYNVNFKALCVELLNKGYLLLDDNETQIEMI